MSEEVEAAVLDALSQFDNQDKWRAWGMHNVRIQGSSILLYGPPGTGKTTIAAWMAKRRDRGFLQLNIGSVGGDGSPGSAEKAVENFFLDGRRRKNATIFIDECNSLLLDRRGDVEASWQPSTTEAVMMGIASYPGLIICATNLAEKLDEAVTQRFLVVIQVERPDLMCRRRLWKVKWPDSFPLQPNEKEVHDLAEYDLNGRQIENVIINTASRAIREKRKPSMTLFHWFCKEEVKKHIDK